MATASSRVNSDYQLHINGGTIVMYAQGDGLDSNGIAVMTGGTAIVHGPTGNGNGAIDAGSLEDQRRGSDRSRQRRYG